MRIVIAAAAALGALGTLNGLILHKQHVLDHGERVLLKLAPRDPRSLMQGDYMALAYDVATRVPAEAPPDGRIVVRRDEGGVGEFVRVDDGTPLVTGEVAIRYRRRAQGIRIGAESWFFQEGRAAQFERARFGELRVASSGEVVLAGLCDEAVRRLE